MRLYKELTEQFTDTVVIVGYRVEGLVDVVNHLLLVVLPYLLMSLAEQQVVLEVLYVSIQHARQPTNGNVHAVGVILLHATMGRPAPKA